MDHFEFVKGGVFSLKIAEHESPSKYVEGDVSLIGRYDTEYTYSGTQTYYRCLSDKCRVSKEYYVDGMNPSKPPTGVGLETTINIRNNSNQEMPFKYETELGEKALIWKNYTRRNIESACFSVRGCATDIKIPPNQEVTVKISG